MLAEYEANDRLDELYDFLVKLGYNQSDEEKSLQNGDHPSFHYHERNESQSADNNVAESQ